MILELLNETCVMWEATGHDKFGTPTYAAAVELPCHWEDKAELFRTLKGEELVSAAVVYLAQQVKRGSMMWYGDLADVPDSADPKSESNSNVYEVSQQGRVKDVEATEALYTAWLL